MATQTQTIPVHTSTVQRSVLADGIFCITSGILSLVGAGAISSFVGLDSSTPILLLGLLLLGYGAELFWLASTNRVNRPVLMTIIALDVAWVVASALLLVANPVGFTDGGKWLVLILADVVIAFGIWQFIALRRMA